MVNRQQQFNQATGRLGNVRSVKDLMAKQLMTLGLTKRMSLKEKLSAQGYTFLQFKGEWGKMFKVNFLKMKKSSGDAWDKTTAWFTKEALGCNLLQLTHENDKLAKFVQNAIETQIMTYQEALDFHEEIRKKIFEGEGRGDKGLLNKAVAKIEDGSEWRMFLRKDPAARKLVVCINIIRDEKAVGEISRKIHSVLNEGEEAKESKFEKKFWDLFNKITKVGKKPVVGFLMGKLKQRFTEVWVDFMLEKAGADEKSNGWSSIARRDIEKQVEAKLRLVVDGFSV